MMLPFDVVEDSSENPFARNTFAPLELDLTQKKTIKKVEF